MDRGGVAPRPLATQGQSLLGIQPIESMLADLPAFAAQHDQQPPMAKSEARLCQFAHPEPEGRQRIALALIAQTGSMETRRHCRAALAHLVAAQQVRHDLTLPNGL